MWIKVNTSFSFLMVKITYLNFLLIAYNFLNYSLIIKILTINMLASSSQWCASSQIDLKSLMWEDMIIIFIQFFNRLSHASFVVFVLKIFSNMDSFIIRMLHRVFSNIYIFSKISINLYIFLLVPRIFLGYSFCCNHYSLDLIS